MLIIQTPFLSPARQSRTPLCGLRFLGQKVQELLLVMGGMAAAGASRAQLPRLNTGKAIYNEKGFLGTLSYNYIMDYKGIEV